METREDFFSFLCLVVFYAWPLMRLCQVFLSSFHFRVSITSWSYQKKRSGHMWRWWGQLVSSGSAILWVFHKYRVFTPRVNFMAMNNEKIIALSPQEVWSSPSQCPRTSNKKNQNGKCPTWKKQSPAGIKIINDLFDHSTATDRSLGNHNQSLTPDKAKKKKSSISLLSGDFLWRKRNALIASKWRKNCL